MRAYQDFRKSAPAFRAKMRQNTKDARIGLVAQQKNASGGDAIRFEQVELELGQNLILSEIDFSVRRGEFVCVIGPSSCGKTTMLRLIAGLLSATRGEVRIGDRAVRAPSPEVAVVFQDYGRALLPWRTASGNVSLALEAIGVPRSERATRIEALLERVGLSAHRDKHPNKLSGGQQQRLQIARCLAQEPTIL